MDLNQIIADATTDDTPLLSHEEIIEKIKEFEKETAKKASEIVNIIKRRQLEDSPNFDERSLLLVRWLLVRDLRILKYCAADILDI